VQGSVPPADDSAHQDSVLIAELAEVNTLLSRYILRLLDVDAGRAEPVHVDDERALIERVVRVADGMHARVERRERDVAQLPFQG
jgi:hypothetical protein